MAQTTPDRGHDLYRAVFDGRHFARGNSIFARKPDLRKINSAPVQAVVKPEISPAHFAPLNSVNGC